MMQFGKFEELQEKGYQVALTLLEEWEADGQLPSVYDDTHEVKDPSKKRGRTLRRNSI